MSGGGSGGGGSSTSTVKNEPAAEVKPYLKPYMDWSWAQTQKPYENYGGQQIAALDPSQQMGMDLTAAQALGGFQGQAPAMQNYADTMSGDFMSPESNPWLAATAQKAMGDITSAYKTGTAQTTDANAGRAGAFGGSAWQEVTDRNQRALGDSLGNAANQFYGQNYMNERNNQMQGLNMLPTMQNVGYTDASKMIGIGDATRSYNQDLLNSQYGNWQEAANYPFKMMETFGNSLRGTMGAGSSSTTSNSGGYKPSPLAGMIGGGIGGYGAQQMMNFAPDMPWLGAGLGAGLGALSF